MKTKSETEPLLLNAVLRDENWNEFNKQFRSEVVNEFQRCGRQRRVVRRIAATAVLISCLAGLLCWRSGRTSPARLIAHSEARPKNNTSKSFLTDQELLKAFPAGTCFLAEVDGHRELVFLSPEVEQRYIAKNGAMTQ